VNVSHGAQMIVSFSVSNFRSFSTEETFSLAASNRLTAHPNHTVSIPDSDQRVLRAGVLYGANGAGKSNLFKALHYVKSVAVRTRRKDRSTGREAFRLGGTADDPSTFDLQIIVAGMLYRFGFKANDQRITEEWLVKVSGGRETIIYERTTDSDGKVIVEAPGLKSVSEKLSALVTIGGPQNQSFLATVKATLDSSDFGEELNSILDWFEDDLKLIDPDSPFAGLGPYLANSPGRLEFASSFLNSVSTGIDHLEIKENEIREEDLPNFIPEEIVSGVRSDLRERKSGSVLLRRSDGNEMFIRKTSEGRCSLMTLLLAHKGRSGTNVEFELCDESDGTKRLLDLIPALFGVHSSNDVYVIDEIERSLHPNLVWAFLNYFLKSCSECRAQIIVTTHESNLLDQRLLRRDEIWFAEKDQTSSTRLYSLTDFKARNDSKISDHYLQGRFGAVPFLGDLDRLHEKVKQTV
jgi:AAA15 family ATPase/GTPase